MLESSANVGNRTACGPRRARRAASSQYVTGKRNPIGLSAAGRVSRGKMAPEKRKRAPPTASPKDQKWRAIIMVKDPNRRPREAREIIPKMELTKKSGH